MASGVTTEFTLRSRDETQHRVAVGARMPDAGPPGARSGSRSLVGQRQGAASDRVDRPRRRRLCGFDSVSRRALAAGDGRYRLLAQPGRRQGALRPRGVRRCVLAGLHLGHRRHCGGRGAGLPGGRGVLLTQGSTGSRRSRPCASAVAGPLRPAAWAGRRANTQARPRDSVPDPTAQNVQRAPA
jgi:hypothetical protein